jgi:RimJ/RimL family protein N-acetyltransferase
MFKPQPVTLRRGALCLEPLTEADLPALLSLADANREQLIYMNGPLRPDWYRQALADQRDGTAVIYAVRLEQELLGTTRFLDFLPGLPAVEIGGTWLATERQGSGLNTAIKFLMLRQAFEQWEMVRVQLKTAASNLRAQRAIEKLGARREGLLRNHRRLADGRLDDSVLYSITDREWPELRRSLEAELGAAHYEHRANPAGVQPGPG